jgi:hypothetical protein
MGAVVVFMLLVGDWRKDSENADAKMYSFERQPYWLNTSLENNVDHALRYNHRLDLKWLDAPEFLPWQKEACAVPTTDTLKCNTNAHRINANWLKLLTVRTCKPGLHLPSRPIPSQAPRWRAVRSL